MDVHKAACYIQLKRLSRNNTCSKVRYGPAHDLQILAECGQIPLIDAHVDVFSGARCLNFGLRFHLHPCSVCVSSKGSLEPSLLTDSISTELLSTGLSIERCSVWSTSYAVHLQQYQTGGGQIMAPPWGRI